LWPKYSIFDCDSIIVSSLELSDEVNKATLKQLHFTNTNPITNVQF